MGDYSWNGFGSTVSGKGHSCVSDARTDAALEHLTKVLGAETGASERYPAELQTL